MVTAGISAGFNISPIAAGAGAGSPFEQFIKELIVSTGVGGLAGGVTAEIFGGDFGQGFVSGAASAAASYVVSSVLYDFLNSGPQMQLVNNDPKSVTYHPRPKLTPTEEILFKISRFLDKLMHPWDYTYSTIDQAAMVAGEVCKNWTKADNVEYGSWIYEYESGYRFQKPFPGQSTEISALKIQWKKSIFRKEVALMHSHPKLAGYDYMNFSGSKPTFWIFGGGGGDIGWSHRSGHPIYLQTPASTLKVYEPKTGSQRIVIP